MSLWAVYNIIKLFFLRPGHLGISSPPLELFFRNFFFKLQKKVFFLTPIVTGPQKKELFCGHFNYSHSSLNEELIHYIDVIKCNLYKIYMNMSLCEL